MSKTVACIIARTVSTRLPLKVLRSIGGEVTMLDFMIKRLKSISSIDQVFICTSREPVDDIMEDIAARNGINVYRGSADNVIERMLEVAEISKAEILLRITGDNPFTSVEYIERQIGLLKESSLDYVRIIDAPIGAAAEVMDTQALKKCYAMMDPSVSEYLMLFMFDPKHFRCGVIKPFQKDYSFYTITVDTGDDLRRTHQIISRCIKPSLEITLADIIIVLENNNIENSKIKGGGTIKLPYGESIAFEDFSKDMKRRIEQSKLLAIYE